MQTYSKHNDGKPVVAEKLIGTLKKKKMSKYITATSKNVYNDKLDLKIHKYDNINQNTIKMKPINLQPNTKFDFGEENYDENPRLTII